MISFPTNGLGYDPKPMLHVKKIQIAILDGILLMIIVVANVAHLLAWSKLSVKAADYKD